MMYRVWLEFVDDSEPLFRLALDEDDEILHYNGAILIAMIRAPTFPDALWQFNRIAAHELGFKFLDPRPPIG